jgi:molecular chaperone DnaJ
MRKNLYLVLGVSPGASSQRIKQAYRDLVKRHHPDGGGSAADPERFRDIQQAYETLGDADRRAAYDLAAQTRQQVVTPRSRTGAGVPLRPFRYPWSVDAPTTGGFLENSADTMAIEMVLTPEEALRGGRFTLAVPVAEPCRYCGAGGLPYPFVCGHCRGRGQVSVEREFTVVLPPAIGDGSSATLPLDAIGLQGAVLQLFIRVPMVR